MLSGSVAANAVSDLGTGNVVQGNQGAPDTKQIKGLSDGASIAVNCDNTDIVKVTLGGNRTMLNPSGTPVDGQKLIFEITQDATGSRTLTWGTNYAFSTDLPAPTLTTTAAATDVLGFMYSATASKWRLIALDRGF